jgi:ABC-type nickel/cobalt efflux system permease component RcnA
MLRLVWSVDRIASASADSIRACVCSVDCPAFQILKIQFQSNENENIFKIQDAHLRDTIAAPSRSGFMSVRTVEVKRVPFVRQMTYARFLWLQQNYRYRRSQPRIMVCLSGVRMLGLWGREGKHTHTHTHTHTQTHTHTHTHTHTISKRRNRPFPSLLLLSFAVSRRILSTTAILP